MGKILIPPIFDQVKDFSEGLAAVKIGEKWGYINEKGEIVIKPEFDSALRFSQGLAPVKKLTQKWPSNSGKTIYKPQKIGQVYLSE